VKPGGAASLRSRRFGSGRRLLGLSAIVMMVLIAADRNGWLLVRQSDELAHYNGLHAMVTRVIDGDTIVIDAPDTFKNTPETHVRLWGIDCPELAHFGKPAEALGEEAKVLAQKLVEHKQVILRLESQRVRDSFGRLLAHVDAADGHNLNEALLEAGLARADDRWPHTMLVRYAQLEYAAKRKGVGLWVKPAKTETGLAHN
jgi:endonuclease YncB( thermonuclease family)